MTSSIAITCSRIQFPCPPSLLFLYLLSPLHPPISGFNPRSLARTPPEMSFRSLYLLCGHQCGSNANKKRSTHKKRRKTNKQKNVWRERLTAASIGGGSRPGAGSETLAARRAFSVASSPLREYIGAPPPARVHRFFLSSRTCSMYELASFRLASRLLQGYRCSR